MYLSVFSVVAVSVVLYLLLLHTQNRASNMVREMLDYHFYSMENVRELKEGVLAHNNAIMRYMAFGGAPQLRESKRQRKVIQTRLEILQKISRNQVLKSRIRELSKNIGVYLSDAASLISFSKDNELPEDAGFFRAANWALGQTDVKKDMALMSAEGQERVSRIYAICDEIININRLEVEQARGRLQNQFDFDLRLSLYGMAVAGAFVLIIGIGLAVSLKGSIETLRDGMKRVNDGDLSVHLPINEAGDLGALTDEFNQMTQTIRHQREKLVRQTITDEMTDVYNQRYFRELLNNEFDRAKRQGRPFSLLMLDGDHFKKYNDTYGHELGNEVIKRIASTVKENLRNMDNLARYGGDEFSVLLPDANHEEAKFIAERLVQSIQEMDYPGKSEEKIPPITLSIGGATFPTDAKNSRDLVFRADDALYRAKQRGRNCVCWSFSSERLAARETWATISFNGSDICQIRRFKKNGRTQTA